MANQGLIFLDYTYLFDADTTFQYVYEFEKLFSDFLATRNFQAEVIKGVEGVSQRRILYITKKPDAVLIGEDKRPVGRPMTTKGIVKKLSERKLRKPALEFIKGKK